MKMLFLAGGSPGTIFGLAPLAVAARNEGHEVFMGTTAEMMPSVVGIGLPGVSLSTMTRQDYMSANGAEHRSTMPKDPAEQLHLVGKWYGRVAESWLPALWTLGADWAPDIVIGGTLSYAAPLLAARLGVPYVRQMWDTLEATGYESGAAAELVPVVERMGLPAIPEPDLRVDVCPPSLRSATAADALVMRWIPMNVQVPLQPWMYTRGRRPRVCVTAGTRVSTDKDLDFLGLNLDRIRRLVEHVGSADDVDIVVAVPAAVAQAINDEIPGIRAGWVPLDVLAPTCDLVVHNDGGLSSLVAMNAGVPQLCIPKLASSVEPARRMAAYGAGIALIGEDDTPEHRDAACDELLSNPVYRKRAAALSQEIAAQRPPAEVVGVMAELARVPTRSAVCEQ